jgi:hypothetical protein
MPVLFSCCHSLVSIYQPPRVKVNGGYLHIRSERQNTSTRQNDGRLLSVGTRVLSSFSLSLARDSSMIILRGFVVMVRPVFSRWKPLERVILLRAIRSRLSLLTFFFQSRFQGVNPLGRFGLGQ